MYGYQLILERRRVGPVRFVVVDAGGNVLEMGFHNEEVMQNFKGHFNGRTLTPEELARIATINEKVIAYLRSHPEARAKLDEFVASRKWPTDINIEELSQIAYFHPQLTPMKSWAMENGFTEQDMMNAGWFSLQFNSNGEPLYNSGGSNVIRIPYLNAEGKIDVWRTRVLGEASHNGHKYLSWPLDRSVIRKFDVAHTLYQGWLLDQAKGRDLILTEGEFKALITWKVGNVLTVGIPGITQVDNTIVDAIIAAEPARVIIILDRDPVGKALMRVDKITDSQRASAMIAMDLIERGLPKAKIRIGILPNIADGDKVGLDDLILANGVGSLSAVIDGSLEIGTYLRSIDLDPQFLELHRRYLMLRRAFKEYLRSAARGGKILPKNFIRGVIEQISILDRGFEVYLRTKFTGARRLAQPYYKNRIIFASDTVPMEEKKVIFSAKNVLVPMACFKGDIFFMGFFTSDVPARSLLAFKSPSSLMFSMSQLNDAYLKRSSNARIEKWYAQGISVLYPQSDINSFKASDLDQFCHIVLAGYLQSTFPPDEYYIEYGLTFASVHPAYVEEVTKTSLTIFRKGSDKVVALASLPVWDPRAPEVLRENGDAVIKSALTASEIREGQIVQFLRQGSYAYQVQQYRQVLDMVYPYYFVTLKERTRKMLISLGLPAAMVDQDQLILMRPADWQDLAARLDSMHLLLAAKRSGLYRLDERAVPAIVSPFSGPVILIPDKDGNGNIVNMRVVPLALRDHETDALPPENKFVYHMYDPGRNYLKVFDPGSFLFLENNLKEVRGKALFITHNELDAMVLETADRHVIGLNGELALSMTAIRKIHAAAPEKIIFVVPSGTSSRYDPFNFDGIPGYLKDLYDLGKKWEAVTGETAPFYVFEAPLTLTNFVRHGSDMGKAATLMRETAVPLIDHLNAVKFREVVHTNAVHSFIYTAARLADYIQIPALSEPLDGKPIKAWVRRLVNAYQKVAESAAAYGKEIPSPDEYFQKLLQLDRPVEVNTLLLSRADNDWQDIPIRRVYRPSGDRALKQGDAWERFRSDFEGTLMPVAQEAVLPEFINQINYPSGDFPGVFKGKEGHPGLDVDATGDPEDISALYRLSQKDPDRVKALNFAEPQEIVKLVFMCKASVEIDGKTIDISGKPATQKAQAKANAATALLQQVMEIYSRLPEKDTSPEFEAVDLFGSLPEGTFNDMMALNELVLGDQQSLSHLEFTESPAGKEFAFTAAIDVDGVAVSVTGRPAKSKKQAKANAAAGLLLKISNSDASMSFTESSPGGIQLNPELYDMKIKGPGNGIPAPSVTRAGPAGYRIDGLSPVIVSITPLHQLETGIPSE